ncbi:putative disease resistance protein At1g50180 [Durio zibethinus]|uniref:Disease resistance protein At1g50180 n=1 Tax=Durio zibethinus TaxID=66656 RepID=A0A6P6ALR7_DURZI|nr:putative disease resistance protein At1g50180 [Durio zibethinus]
MIRNWVAEIRDIAYDAEDVLEIYALKAVESRRSSSSRYAFLKCSFLLGKWNNIKLLCKVGSEIEGLTARLNILTARLPTYGLKEIKERERPPSSPENWFINRRTYSHKIEQNVVGLEEDTNFLLTQLVRTDCRVVAICGMGGLGKTTLAKKVYHQCKVGRHFEFFIWVFVSQQWQQRNIWETFLYELLSPSKERLGDGQMEKEFKEKWKEIQKMNNDAVAKMLHEELQKSKCLVVLDDIWDNIVWDALKPGFPTEETSTKFMITTRNRNLVHRVDPNVFIHEPRCLNDEDSWELFEKTAIPKLNINPAAFVRDAWMYITGNSLLITIASFIFVILCKLKQPHFSYLPSAYRVKASLEKLGREMVKHCRGLPLAIVVLGGLLSSKRTYDEWDTIHQCIKSYLKREDFGIFQLLALSYDDLLFELKPCFLYLGVLPEDFQISRDRLINLWVAEGIILQPRKERESEESLEDVAYRYLTELTERYMVNVERRDPSGRIKRCQMHDLMREFCLSKAEEENFFQVLPCYGAREKSLNISSSSTKEKGRVRRLSLHLNNFPGDIALQCEESPFRSVIGFSLDRYSGISQTLIETFVRKFKLLRILDLEGVKGFGIPETIGKLIHLRLLNLRSAWIGNLPPSIGNLSCLLTLRLDPFESATTIPDVLWKLKRLRHLYLPPWYGSGTERLQFADLSDLRTLVNFQTCNAEVEDLIRLTNLRKLKIVIFDEISQRRFKRIFESPTITFNYLRDFSIELAISLLSDSQDIDNIKSRCPRLQRLKLNGKVVYQKTPDVFRIEEE